MHVALDICIGLWNPSNGITSFEWQDELDLGFRLVGFLLHLEADRPLGHNHSVSFTGSNDVASDLDIVIL